METIQQLQVGSSEKTTKGYALDNRLASQGTQHARQQALDKTEVCRPRLDPARSSTTDAHRRLHEQRTMMRMAVCIVVGFWSLILLVLLLTPAFRGRFQGLDIIMLYLALNVPILIMYLGWSILSWRSRRLASKNPVRREHPVKRVASQEAVAGQEARVAEPARANVPFAPLEPAKLQITRLKTVLPPLPPNQPAMLPEENRKPPIERDCLWLPRIACSDTIPPLGTVHRPTRQCGEFAVIKVEPLQADRVDGPGGIQEPWQEVTRPMFRCIELEQTQPMIQNAAFEKKEPDSWSDEQFITRPNGICITREDPVVHSPRRVRQESVFSNPTLPAPKVTRDAIAMAMGQNEPDTTGRAEEGNLLPV